MEILYYALTTIIVISVVLVTHELGHLLVGQAFGIKATHYKLGMGKVIYTKMIKGIPCSICMLPIGGSVGFGDSAGDTRYPDDINLFNAPPIARIFTVLAGCLVNLFEAFVLAIAYSISAQTTILNSVKTVWYGFMGTLQSTVGITLQVFTGAEQLNQGLVIPFDVSVTSALLMYSAVLTLLIAGTNLIPIPPFDGYIAALSAVKGIVKQRINASRYRDIAVIALHSINVLTLLWLVMVMGNYIAQYLF